MATAEHRPVLLDTLHQRPSRRRLSVPPGGNASKEGFEFIGRAQPELAPKVSYTDLVLPYRQLAQPLRDITTDQHPVSIFVTAIKRQCTLAEHDGRCKVATFVVGARQLMECLKIRYL